MIERNGKQYPNPTYQQSLEAWCLLNDLIKLGYPHDFLNGRPHIRSYMWKVTDLVRDAIHIRDSSPGVLTVIGGRMDGRVEFAKAVNEMMQKAYIHVPRKNGKTMFNAPTEDAEPVRHGKKEGEKNVGWQPETQPKGKPPVEKMKGAETIQKLIDAGDLMDWSQTVPLTDDGGIDINDFEEKLKSMPTIDAEPRWIPCSERLPEVRQWVLCQCRAGIMDVLRLTADGKWNKNYPHTDYMSGFVVAWMPLPKPYEVEE